MRLFRSDFQQAKLDHYDYIYLYLWPEQLKDIEDWIFSHIDKRTILISNSFMFVSHRPYKEIFDTTGKVVLRLYRL